MKIEIREHEVILTREMGDPRFYDRHGTSTWGQSGERQLLGHLRWHLNANGHDFVCKRMWKDGHMVDDHQSYLRTRSEKSPGLRGMIYNGSYALRGAHEDWNRQGRVVLDLERCDPGEIPSDVSAALLRGMKE